jgi:hypothetical protein
MYRRIASGTLSAEQLKKFQADLKEIEVGKHIEVIPKGNEVDIQYTTVVGKELFTYSVTNGYLSRHWKGVFTLH